MPRAPCRRKTGGRAGPARVLLSACVLFSCAPLAARAAAAEPALRLDPALTAPAENFPPDERALLRVEYQAAQARAAEADVLGDILHRVRNINGMINDIHGIVATWPIAGVPAPGRSEAAARAAPLPPDANASATTPEMAIRALMAATIVFLFWLLGRRHLAGRRRRAALAEQSLAATPTVIPEEDAAAMPSPASSPGQTPHEADHGRPRGAAFHAHPAPSEPPAASADPAPGEPVLLDAFEFELPDVPSPPAAANEAPVPGGDARIDQSIELAEIMVSMGLAQGAADALTEHIRANPKRALYHWLKLLEVYRRSQMKDDFERTALELRQTFNVQPVAWGGATGRFSIEDFPHLSTRLQELWPTPACAGFLAHLLEDNRGGTRNGLPQCVAEEILLLEQILGSEAVAAAA